MNMALDDRPSKLPDSPALDAELCRRARLSRDPRFDGEFFIAVRTTGIYCRPVCPARSPAEHNVSYFASAAQSAAAGFRPCLRCRPESAPNSPAWMGTSTTVRRALQMINQGALNQGKLEQLASRLGVGERYLRKLFQRELGLSPQAIALNQRLLFAKKLLAETTLPLTDVAFAAGFGSVRRFNSAVREQFKLTPGNLRKQQRKGDSGSGIVMQLHYRPPYDWDGVIDLFRRHAISGVETVSDDCYQRKLTLAGNLAEMRVSPIKGRNALRLELHLPNLDQLMPLVARVRRMFDLDANPAMIAAVLGADPLLQPLLEACPGVRSPSYGCVFESSIRAIVGQQVSIVAARNILGRLAAACGADPQQLSFPSASAIAALDDSHFPMPGRRRETLRSVCQAYSEREQELDTTALAQFKGIGPWSVNMVAMRGCADPDAFPLKDLGIDKAWAALGGDHFPLQQHIANWRPWRAYAANLLWKSLSA